MATYLSKEQLQPEIASKFSGQGSFHLRGSDGLSSKLSKVLIAPVAIGKPIAVRQLNNTVVAGIHVENATPEASLQDGFYTVRISYHNNVPVAELVSNGVVVKRAHTTRLVPTAAVLHEPEAIVIEGASAAVFLGGVVVGMVIAMYILR